MLGRQHLLAGAASWLAAVPLVDATAGVTGSQTVLGVAVAAGAGMLPDLDQPGASISRTYGFLTQTVARGVAAVFGGHRNGTHSILGWVGAVTGAALCAAAVGWGLWLLLWLLLGVVWRTLRDQRRHWPIIHGFTMALVVAAVASTGVAPTVPVVGGVAVGYASHIATDMLTPQRCPLWWPFSKRRYGVGLVTTGSRVSGPVVTFVLWCAVLGAGVWALS